MDMVIGEHLEVLWYAKLQADHAIRGDGQNKLRTYRKFKKEYCTEAYVKTLMPLKHRSALAKFRCGVAPLKIETGRYGMNRLPANERLCEFCENNEVEDEFHVVMICNFYDDIRHNPLQYVSTEVNNFDMMTDNDKFNFLMSSPLCMKQCARALAEILNKRQCTLNV